MAIAAWFEDGGTETAQSQGPCVVRPGLRLVDPQVRDGTVRAPVATRPGALAEGRPTRRPRVVADGSAVACAPGSRRPEVVTVLARRARARRNRRRLLAGGTVGGLLVGLALPLSVLGGSPASAQGGTPGAALAGSTVDVVQPGDTLWSIAVRFDRGGDPRPLAEAIARETGSANVVPGEHIAIP